MAAGKSGGSAGGVFLKGTFGSPSGESGGGKFATPGTPPPGRDTQLCTPGGLGATGVRMVHGGQGTRCGRADFGAARVKG